MEAKNIDKTTANISKLGDSELNAYEAWRQISGKDPFLCRKCKTGRMR